MLAIVGAGGWLMQLQARSMAVQFERAREERARGAATEVAAAALAEARAGLAEPEREVRRREGLFRLTIADSAAAGERVVVVVVRDSAGRELRRLEETLAVR